MMQESLAEKLRIMRARRGFTLTEASERTGVDRHTLRGLEHGGRRPNFSTLEKIARGYGVDVAELVAERDYPTGRLVPLEQGQRHRDEMRERVLAGIQRDEQSDLFWGDLWPHLEDCVKAANQLVRDYKDNPADQAMAADVLTGFVTLHRLALLQYLKLHYWTEEDAESHEPLEGDPRFEQAPLTEREMAEVFAWRP